MNFKKFVKAKDNEKKYQSYLLLLQNFDKPCLKVTRHSCGSKDFDNSTQLSIKNLVKSL